MSTTNQSEIYDFEREEESFADDIVHVVTEDGDVVEIRGASQGQTIEDKIENLEYPHRSEEILRELYIERGMTTYEIRDRLGCSRSTLRKWMDKAGIERRGTGSGKNGPWRDESVLREMYVEKGMTLREIAADLDCGESTVQRNLVKNGIETRSGAGQATSGAWDDEETLRRLYIDEELSQAEIGDRLGCSQRTVSRYLRKNGIETRRNCAEQESVSDSTASIEVNRETWQRLNGLKEGPGDSFDDVITRLVEEGSTHTTD